MFPVVAKIVDVVDRLFAGVLDDLAQSGFVGGQVLAAKIGVRDTPCGAGCFEHVEMRVGPAHGHLQCQVQPVQPDISRHLQGAGDSGLDVLQGDFDLDDAHAGRCCTDRVSSVNTGFCHDHGYA